MNRRAGSLVVALGVLLVACVSGVIADDFTLDWWTVDGGGHMWTSAGEFELSGTIGQADGGVSMTGGDFELVGGFWPGVEEYCPCDLDCDGDVDLSDLAELLAAYGTCPGDEGYNPAANVYENTPPDGCIDLNDLAELLGHYGEVCP
jgi:hypothetical protein